MSVGYEKGNFTTEMRDRPAVSWQEVPLDAAGRPLPKSRGGRGGDEAETSRDRGEGAAKTTAYGDVAMRLLAAACLAAAAPAAAGRGSGSLPRASGSPTQRVVTEAEAGARKETTKSVKALARLEGQLLAERDTERAAIVFLDLVENYPGTPAASQAMFYLGQALVGLEMDAWAVECFGRNLVDTAPDGRRYHQRSVAELLRLLTPARQPGFARNPGLSATPERRARIRSWGARSWGCSRRCSPRSTASG